MRTAYSYVRFSTRDQADGNSLQRQREAAINYAAKNNLHLDTSYIDPGLSAHKGKTVKKGAFGRFVKAVEAGEIPPGSILLIEAFDRFSRQDVLSAMSLLTTLLQRGITVVTLEDNQSYTAESARDGLSQIIVAVVKMQAAYEYSQRLGKRLKSAWQGKRDTAEKPLTKWCPAWCELNENTGNFIEIKKRANLVREIFQMCADGMGKERIARELNERGVPTWEQPGKRPQARQWYTGYIARILSNRAVLGEFQAHLSMDAMDKDGRDVRRAEAAGSVRHGYYPAVVDRALWDRVHAVRQARKATGGPKVNVHNLFTGLIRCSACGSSMMMRNKGDHRKIPTKMLAGYQGWRTGNKLVCSAAFARRRDPLLGELVCDMTEHVNYHEIEGPILDHLGELALPRGGQPASPKVRQIEAEVGTLRDEITRNRTALDSLLVDLGDRPEILASITRVEASITEKQRQAAALERDLSTLRGRQPSSSALEAIRELREAAESNDPVVRRAARLKLAEALKGIVDQIEVVADISRAFLVYGVINQAIIEHGTHRLLPDRAPYLGERTEEELLERMREFWLRATKTPHIDENGEEGISLSWGMTKRAGSKED
ncbi:recombinase family protein [Belnapia sp. F-4-1]|uniref:recombinase family protein n=1 Tax=Belnapia sp. F-4-1 TaxID=1545443 RepID=UPI0009DF07B7|nr:recombinase family protein [Belnapia sp. F-4-1]